MLRRWEFANQTCLLNDFSTYLLMSKARGLTAIFDNIIEQAFV
jgi:hypothetical protein